MSTVKSLRHLEQGYSLAVTDFESELGLVNLHRGKLNLLPDGGNMGYTCANHDAHRAIGSVPRRLI